MHQQGFARFQVAALEHVVPDREKGFRNARRLDHRQRADRQRVALVRQAIFRIAAADHQGHHAVAELPALDARSQRHDFAGDLEAGNIRRARRRRVEALALHHVGPVDAGGRYLDQDLAIAGVGTARCSGTSTCGPPGP